MAATAPATSPTAKPPLRPARKRSPGRPRAVRLDAPRPVLPAAQPEQSPPHAPKFRHHKAAVTGQPKPQNQPQIRRLADISPPKPKPRPDAAHHAVHKVGVAPLHFGAIIAASLRARVKPHWLSLAALGALAFGIGCGYVIWLMLTGGLPKLATHIASTGAGLWIEAGILALLYYIGRSIGHTAIVYGLAREADVRPVSLGQQLGTGINTFGRRLVLDLGFGAAELVLLGLGGALVIWGGGTWPVASSAQLITLFIAFLALLYLLTALALTRSLSGVNLTLSGKPPWPAAKIGWRLFSHRLELFGWRFVMLALELILALPLAALAIGLIITVPAIWRPELIVVAALLAWLAGALFGAGTAAWWTMLYRKLVAVSLPDAPPGLLNGHTSHAARRGPLALIVALTSFLIAAALAIPWLKFN